ncbi:MAG TPA: hypothetical protein VNO14_18575 [Blastocatellia bacterium]|nr:hypothetical protein [Blastocatellia bacterium]
MQSKRVRNRDGLTNESELAGADQKASGFPHSALYRDPADVRTILSLTRCGIVLVLLLVTSVGANLYQYYRRPDRIVVDRSSGRVLQINDREYGETEAVQLGPDRLTDADKKYIAGEFVEALYRVDPATRPKDIERALRMMVPDSALKFARYLKQEGVLEKQQKESWQSVWTVQDISVDSHDRYSVRVLGRQDITRLDNGAPVQEPRQLSLSLKLMADPKGRADRNLRSGFIISSFDYKEIQQ